MNSKVSIIMYHYVRDLKYSKFPQIKGLDYVQFVEQINYLKKYYYFITMEDLLDAIDNNESLPPKAVLLTFDDAYIDHYTYVFPLLDELKIQGSFFPPVKAIMEHTILDVNKIHFILASARNENELIKDIRAQIDINREGYNLNDFEYYWSKLARPCRYDNKEVAFIKRLLQVELPKEIRNIIVDFLFRKYVSDCEESFSRELYMSIDQVKCMRRNGMHIGSHGYDHYWLGSLSREEQEFEINKSRDFIQLIGGQTSFWTMCYPYGNFNQDTLDLLEKADCKLGLTTFVGIADIVKEKRLCLSRLDTNDIPKYRDSLVNDWFFKS